MPASFRSPLLTAPVACAFFLYGCGGGPGVEVSSIPSSIEVSVSAGAPVSGATVTVFAVSDATGEVNGSAGAGGVLGSAGPTDANGHVTVPLKGYSGPVQIVAKGSALQYPDPTLAQNTSGVAASIQVPSSFEFSSYVTSFKTSAGSVVPVTLLTTLADHAALAYARGRHPLHPGVKTISTALADRDALFVRHITTSAAAWSPASLRTTVPAALGASAQTLVDGAYAAMFDLALNELARKTAQLAGYGSDSTAVNAVTLTQLLEQDLDADGRLDGKGQDGQPLSTLGQTPVALTGQFLRKPLAQALDEWIQNKAVNHSGIAQADLVSTGVYNAITLDGSDLFADPPAGPFDPVDHTPPEVSLASASTPYLNTVAISFDVNATDPSGVKAVYAQTDSATGPVTGTVQGTLWHFEKLSLRTGRNSVTVWAADLSQPSNVGFGLPAPYSFTLTPIVDTAGPATPTLDGSFASYIDERYMMAVTDPTGAAAVPAAYTFGSQTKSALAGGSDVFKASTRLAWSTQPTAAVLETTNPDNIPAVRFNVAFDPNSKAPITSARYAVDVQCTGCSYPTTQGDLWPSSTVTNSWLLPLSSNLIPALASLPGPAQIAIRITLTDAAGNNSTTGPFNLTFHVVGPPVAVSEDTAYPTYMEPKSTYPYKLANNSYAQLWNANTTVFVGNQVRLLRYVITNPAPQPIGVAVSYTQAATGSWAINERWDSVAVPEIRPRPDYSNGNLGPVFTLLDGCTGNYTDFFLYSTIPPNLGFPVGQCKQNEVAGHYLAGVCIGFTINCYLPTTGTGAPSAAATAAVTPQLFAGPLPSANEVVAPATAGSAFIVPAASAAAPGGLVLYLTRPAAMTIARTTSLPSLTWGTDLGGAYYQHPDAEAWLPIGTTTYNGAQYTVGEANRFGRVLATSVDHVTGAMNVVTQGVSGAVLLGESRLVQTAPLDRDLAAH